MEAHNDNFSETFQKHDPQEARYHRMLEVRQKTLSQKLTIRRRSTSGYHEIAIPEKQSIGGKIPPKTRAFAKANQLFRKASIRGQDIIGDQDFKEKTSFFSEKRPAGDRIPLYTSAFMNKQDMRKDPN
jgi:hypothetical protein